MEQIKKCPTCREVKPLANFYRDRSNPDGRRYDCKVCALAYCHLPENRAKKRRYEKSEDGKDVFRRYQQSKKGRASQRRYYRRNKKKHNARCKVNQKVSWGTLPRPDSLQCDHCDERAEQSHHDDYDKPFDITPLCRHCHAGLHKIKP